jgi:hypothetical protein
MSHVASIMLKALRYRENYITTKALALLMNDLEPSLKMSDRKLRGHGGKPGLLEACSREIFTDTGFFIVRRMEQPPGVRLTNDKRELESAMAQWSSFIWNLKRGTIDEYGYYLNASRKGLGPLFDAA